MKLDNLKELVKEELKRALNEDASSIETLEDAVMFLNNNRQSILQIADNYAGDVQGMQHAINTFLKPFIENTPQPIVDRIKAAIGGAISKRNIQNNPELSQAYDKLKDVNKIVK
jgi:uncharacterized protein YoxC